MCTGINIRNLNHYIEAQVHGDVILSEDVDYLVADPSFSSTETANVFEEISIVLGLPKNSLNDSIQITRSW